MASGATGSAAPRAGRDHRQQAPPPAAGDAQPVARRLVGQVDVVDDQHHGAAGRQATHDVDEAGEQRGPVRLARRPAPWLAPHPAGGAVARPAGQEAADQVAASGPSTAAASAPRAAR